MQPQHPQQHQQFYSGVPPPQPGPAYGQFGYQPQPGAPPLQQPPPQANSQGVDGFFSSVASNFGPIGNTFTLIQGGQHYVQQVQQKMGFLSGTGLNYHFAISTEYVRTKILMLLTPYLRRWNFSRVPEQIPGGPKYQPPRLDANCPDLYIPLMAVFTFVMLGSVPKLLEGGFSPEVMYTKVYRCIVGWLCNMLVVKGFMFAMSLSSAVSMIEAMCYTGYLYVLLCINALAVIVKVPYMGIATWMYASICMALYLIKSFKCLIHHEARHYGGDPSRYNYLLLAMALIQFPTAYFLGP